MMTISGASLNNPDPQNWHNITYQVKPGDCLWNLAMQIVQEEAQAEGKTLSGADLEQATAKELALIEHANPQIVASNGSGTYDLIYPGDTIAVPVETPTTPFIATSAGDNGWPSSSPGGIPPSGTSLKPGQDILSPDGKYDLVMLPNGDLVLYKLTTPNYRTEGYAGDTMIWQSGTIGQPVDHVSLVFSDTPYGAVYIHVVLYDSHGNSISNFSIEDPGFASSS